MKRAIALLALVASVSTVSACGTRVQSDSLATAQAAEPLSADPRVEDPADIRPPEARPSTVAEAAPAGVPATGAPATRVAPTNAARSAPAPTADVRAPRGAVAAGKSGGDSAGSSGAASGAGATAAAPGAPSPATPSADRSPWVIGSVGTTSGLAGIPLKPQVDALQAWVKWTNDKGGINGHPVALTVADDGGDPARHRSLVQEFVERRGVMAFVHNTEALTGKGSVDYLTAKGIPVIGSDTGNEYFNTNPNYFPQVPSNSGFIIGMLAGTANYVLPQGKTKLGTATCTEAQACTDESRIWKEQAGAYGFKLVYEARASLAQPDFTAECLAARNAGVEVIMFGLISTTEMRFASSCARQGIKFIYSLAAPDAANSLAKDPNLNGSSILSYNAFPWTVNTTPPTAEFQQVLTKYLREEPSGANAYGWVSAKLFEKAASRLTGAPSTQALLEGLWAIKNDTLGGLTAPLTFTKGQPARVPVCWFEMVIKDQRWTALHDAPRCRGK